MANSKLKGKIFPVPHRVLDILSQNLKKYSDMRDSKGYNRSLFILNKKASTYEQLKRIKNYFDSLNDDNFNEIEFQLNGGEVMKNWVNDTLRTARERVKNLKTLKRDSGMSDQFRKSDDLSVDKPASGSIRSVPDFMSTSELNEEIQKIIKLIKH